MSEIFYHVKELNIEEKFNKNNDYSIQIIGPRIRPWPWPWPGLGDMHVALPLALALYSVALLTSLTANRGTKSEQSGI